MAARCIRSGPGAPSRPEGRLGVRLQDAFTTLSGLLGRGSGANRNRRKRTEYLLRFRSGIRCRSRRWERSYPRRFRRGNPFPRNRLTSPRIGRPFTCVMVARRRSRIAWFSPAIHGAFRHTRLSPLGGSFGSPGPGVNRGGGPSSPGAAASLPSRRKRLAFRRLSPSVRVGASPDEAPKRLACAGRPAVRRAFAILANRAAPLSPGRPKPPGEGDRTPPASFRSPAERETLRVSPVRLPVRFGCPFDMAFRPCRPGPPRAVIRPSSIHGAGFSVSPTSRSESHPVKADRG